MIVDVELRVAGMHCASCERNLTIALSTLPGVERVEADRTADRVRVRFDPALCSRDSVRRAIEDMGYELG